MKYQIKFTAPDGKTGYTHELITDSDVINSMQQLFPFSGIAKWEDAVAVLRVNQQRCPDYEFEIVPFGENDPDWQKIFEEVIK